MFLKMSSSEGLISGFGQFRNDIDNGSDEKLLIGGTKISFDIKSKACSIKQSEPQILLSSDEDVSAHDEKSSSNKFDVTKFEGGVAHQETEREDEDNNLDSLVIPMVKEKDWRFAKLEKIGVPVKEDSSTKPVHGIFMSQVLPADPVFVTKCVLEKAEEPVPDANYDCVPVEAFGLAVLRGCGWKEGEGIGRSNKRVVPLRLPPRRPKGLGLGAELSVTQIKQIKPGNNKNDDETCLKKMSFVKILSGSNRDAYGQIESFDEDNSSVIVKLALGGKNVRVNEYSVIVVSKKEFERNGKCINQKAYEQEAAKIEARKRKEAKYDSYSAGSSASTQEASSGHISHHSKRPRESGTNMRECNDWMQAKKSGGIKRTMWVRPDLRVRFINKDYKNGDLYNEKVCVVDIVGRSKCIVRDESGRIYYDICEDWLETLVPKNKGSKVMLLGDRWSGQLAVVMERDKQRKRLLARILLTDELASVTFDDACEFIGLTDED
ncbi:hypothetical protein AB6A40_001757 [Gnathostoma spinigerum]|uniref:G-patch domain-containing protein n=1 Tax=Gnathostoma spinigerum TaxID=75299 RepID=A0ABD6E522_9BILA